MQSYVTRPTYVAHEALYRFRLVTANADGEAALATAVLIPVGALLEPAPSNTYASGSNVVATPLLPGSQMRLMASAAINAGEFVKHTAAGKIAPEADVDAATVNTVGIALETCTTDGDVILVVIA